MTLCSPQPVWLDCDPGHDDAMAIILAGWNPNVHLLGISTVAGNQSVEKVTQNALDILEVAGLHHIRVVQGQAKPLMRETALLCPEIHGETGLDGPDGGPVLPHSARRAVPGKAVLVIFEAISEHYNRHQQKVKLVCTGALTNAALLVLLFPEVMTMVELVLMGGSMGVGNTGPVQEFNIQVDPEAAKIVFESGLHLTMVPLQVTHTALVTPAVLSRLITGDARLATAASTSSSDGGVSMNSHNPLAAAAGFPAVQGAGNALADDDGSSTSSGSSRRSSSSGDVAAGGVSVSPFKLLMEQLLTFFGTTYRTEFKFQDPPLHDPCAVAYVISPEVFQVELMRVDIETKSDLAAGQTVCDIWHASKQPKNCWVAKSMDVEHFWELMLAALVRADAASPMNLRFGRQLQNGDSSSSSDFEDGAGGGPAGGPDQATDLLGDLKVAGGLAAGLG